MQRGLAWLGLAAMLLAGCAAPAGRDAPGAGGSSASPAALDVQRLDGCASREAAQRSDVVAGQAALQELWNRSCGGGPAPVVDFAQRTVVAYFWGQKPTGGFRVEILNATAAGGTVTVRVARDAPGAGCVNAQVVTYPAGLATIPRTAASIGFDAVDRTVPC